MNHYLIIQSQDPFTQARAPHHYALAQSLDRAGNSVRLLLVQHGVSVAHRAASSPAFDELLNSGVHVFVDKHALAERNLRAQELHANVNIAGIEMVIQALLSGDRVIWH